MKIRWIILPLTTLLLCCGCYFGSRPEYDCHEHGEFIDGECLCDYGWAGLGCDIWAVDSYKGTFVLQPDTCNPIGWDMDTISITTNYVSEHSILIQCKGLLRPITGILKAGYEASIDIPTQSNFAMDSLLGQIPVTIEGKASISSRLAISLDSTGCKHFFTKQ